MPAIRSGRVRAALLLGIFLLMLLGNVLTPYAVDDWAYMHSFATGERLMHFGEIFPSMAAHAQTMNGRLFSHFWAQLFLLLPKGVFDAVNALVFTALIALLARLVQSEEGPNNLILLMIFCAVWVFVPAFGQVFFWLDGACNYGWGCAAGLAFLAPYIRLFERDAEKKPVFWILWMLAGFYTGAYLENMAVGAIFLSALLLFGRRAVRKKKNGFHPLLPVLAALGGFLFMMTRPAEGMKSGADVSLMSLGTGLVAALEKYRLLAVPLIVFAVTLVTALWYHARRERILLAAALVLGSLCANFALGVATYYPERCLAFPAILLIAADAVLLSELFSGKTKLPVLCAAAALVLPTLYWGVFGFADITNVYFQVRSNETAVTEAAARGESSVTVPYVETLTRYSALYDLKYLDTENPQSWPNNVMADVLGIGEIRCEPDAAKEAERCFR